MAGDLNKAMIIGRLTRDPETRTTPSGQTVTSFSVATNLTWNDASGQKQERVEYHNVVAWRKLGEICAQYLKKGGKVFIEGRIQTRSWEGKDGGKRNRTEIVAENMSMLDSKGSSSGVDTSVARSTSPAETGAPAAPKEEPSEGEINIEEIPF